MTAVSAQAVELAGDGIWPADAWQMALDGVGPQERIDWLLANAMPAERRFWTPDALVIAHAGARLMEVGPYGEQPVHAPT